MSQRPNTHTALHRWVFKVPMPAKTRINLIERLADVENNLASATSERLQVGNFGQRLQTHC